MTEFGDAYRGRRVLVTGHTGFKGTWLAAWLARLGASLTGIALDPDTEPSHWDQLALDVDDRRIDIRDAVAIRQTVAAIQPEVVFHLAAQPLVRRSYSQPLVTWSTNVLGSANLLDACRGLRGVQAIVVITTDKVYANDGRHDGYRENDRLGGFDPYSASKAACELLIDSYRQSFFSCPDAALLASARAGNVIGGGDWAEDRLIPDAVRAVRADSPVAVRSPLATRPWQHVLECLSGYLLLGQRLLAGDSDAARAWNFGPDADDNLTVGEVLDRMRKHWPALTWRDDTHPHPHEAARLHLDCTQARTSLAWRPVWRLDRALGQTATWYRAHHESEGVLTAEQIDAYVNDARDMGLAWAG